MVRHNPFGRSRRRKQWQRAENRRLERRQRAMEELPFWPGVPQWEQQQIETQNQNDQIQCHICYSSPEETNAEFFFDTFCECAGNVGTVCEDCILTVIRQNPQQCMTCHRPWKNVRFTQEATTFEQFQEWHKDFIEGMSSFLAMIIDFPLVWFTFGYLINQIKHLSQSRETGTRHLPEHLHALKSVPIIAVAILVVILYIFLVLYIFLYLAQRLEAPISWICYRMYRPFSRYGPVTDVQILAQN